ncbi:hypothetical protein GGI12_004111 [Dipsacomyces acuminosporus]|nr:hypothetical protein GGI12_004111 [Dipsacomyces acuminosporus]
MRVLNMLAKRLPRMTDEQRINAAAKLGLKLDPVGTGETVLIIVGFTLYGLMAVLIALAWLNRNYKPIKAKNLPNITLMFIATVCWAIGVMPGNGIVAIVGVWSHCRFWAVWIRMTMTYTYVFLVVFRTHALYRIFILRKPCRGIGYYIPVIIFTVFILSFCITSTAVTPEMSVRYVPSLEICSYSKAFHIVCIAFAGVLWVIHTIYIFVTRNIRSSFNEFRESLIIYLVGVTNLLVALFLHFMVKAYPLHKYVRIVSTVCDVLCGCIPVIILLAHPVYMCYFRHDEYLSRWKSKLVAESMVEIYKLQNIDVSISTLAAESTGHIDGHGSLQSGGKSSNRSRSDSPPNNESIPSLILPDALHINGLDYDILHRLFRIIRNRYDLSIGHRFSANYRQLVKVSSVCRYWRAFLLPHLHGTLYVKTKDGRRGKKSNAEQIIKYKLTSYVRVFDVEFRNRRFEDIDPLAVFHELRVDKVVWGRVKRLAMCYPSSKSGNDASVIVKWMLLFFGEYMPGITELEYRSPSWPVFEGSVMQRCHCALFSEFACQYSALSSKLTHLTVCMDSSERRVLALAFAPALQFLRITHASPDITWNWFDSNDGNDIWFRSLKTLQIEFSLGPQAHRPTYLSHNLSAFSSSYRGVVRRVHFPQLEMLAIRPYCFWDDSFHRLFEGCPLKQINIDSPKGAKNHIPPTMLASIADLKLHVSFDNSQFDNRRSPGSAKEAAYNQSLAKLFSAATVAQRVELSTDSLTTLLLPGELRWTFVESLYLAFWIDMKSIYTVLAHMPRLRNFSFHLYLKHSEAADSSAASTGGADQQQLRTANSAVKFIEIFNPGTSALPRDALLYCLKNLLPLVPSLSSLKVSYHLVSYASKVVADPANSLEWISEQLVIAHSKLAEVY